MFCRKTTTLLHTVLFISAIKCCFQIIQSRSRGIHPSSRPVFPTPPGHWPRTPAFSRPNTSHLLAQPHLCASRVQNDFRRKRHVGIPRIASRLENPGLCGTLAGVVLLHFLNALLLIVNSLRVIFP